MWGRLLMKAAVLLVAWVGSAAMANEPRTEADKKSKLDDSRRVPVSATEQSGESAPPDATAPSNVAVGRNPRVVVITDAASPQCQRELERLQKPGGEFAAMRAQGWKIGTAADSHVQLVDRSAVPDLVRQLHPSEFPAVACLSDGEIIRSFKEGCSTPLDAWTFGWLIKGVNERPRAPIPEAIRVATTGHYPLRGNHWSVDGDSNPSKETLVTHLRSATHVNFLNADYKIEDWSVEELRSLHDDLHERYGPAGSSPAASIAKPSGFDQFSGNRKALGKY
jgi:hypothetical protein